MYRLIETAKTTAVDAQTQLEERAKGVGIPVEEYKKQAYETIEGLQKRLGYAADQVDAKARDMNGSSKTYFSAA